MKVEKVLLINYRNYTGAETSFFDGLNILIGDNGQGKTNLVESIILSCIGRSPRTPRDKELIRGGQTRAYVRIEGQKRTGRVVLETTLSTTEHKQIRIDGCAIRRMGELMGSLNAVYFSPDEMRIVKAGPSERRHFLDVDLSQLSKRFFYELSRYNQILYQRNKLLKSGRASPDALAVWDMQLVASGAKIMYQRKAFARRLNSAAQKIHAFLTDDKEDLSIVYDGIEGDTEEALVSAFSEELLRTRERDLRLFTTTAGPQKDDLLFLSGETDLRSYGSQGQQRTAALSLKLAELAIFSELLSESPVLILDDVLSELDPDRSEKLFSCIRAAQTFITCTHLEHPIPNAHLFKVQNATVQVREQFSIDN